MTLFPKAAGSKLSAGDDTHQHRQCGVEAEAKLGRMLESGESPCEAPLTIARLKKTSWAHCFVFRANKRACFGPLFRLRLGRVIDLRETGGRNLGNVGSYPS